MEINEQELLHTEVINIKDARFLDHLEEGFEDFWLDFARTAKQSGELTSHVMVRIWLDESVPPVFRDRAMLLIFGSGKTYNKISGQTVRRYSESVFYDNILVLARNEANFDPALYAQWIKDAFAYQKTYEPNMISESLLLRQWQIMFSLGILGEDEFHDNLSHINLWQAMPKEDADEYRLDSFRFPVLDDLIKRNESEMLQSWAFAQLRSWLDFQRGEVAEAPPWLAAIKLEQGLALFQDLLLEVTRDQIGIQIPTSNLTWEYLEPAIHHFGWSKILKHPYMSQSLGIVKKITAKPLQADALKSMIREYRSQDDRGTSSLLEEDDIEFVRGMADESGDRELAQLVTQAIEDMHTAQIQYEKSMTEWKNRDRQKAEERQIELAAEATKKLEAKRHFEGLLEIIRGKEQ